MFRGRAVGGAPRGDLEETSEAAWVAPGDLPALPVEPSTRFWIDQALAEDEPPHLA